MAEYIDQNELLSILNDKYESIADINSIIIDMKPADVIERSEYEKLRLVNLDLAETNKGLLAEHEQLEKLRSKCEQLEKENQELKEIATNAIGADSQSCSYIEKLESNIEKAIEEIKQCKVYGRTKTARLISLPEVLEILKRNLEDTDFKVSGSPNIKLQEKEKYN